MAKVTYSLKSQDVFDLSKTTQVYSYEAKRPDYPHPYHARNDLGNPHRHLTACG